MSEGRAPLILMVAAEASGDALAADLIAALRRRRPGLRFVGVGGPAMAREGVASAFDIAGLSVAGWFEGLAAYGEVKRRVAQTAALAARERPDAAVLVDSWGFTLRVAQALRRLPDPPVIIKYVAPQVWASRPGRARTLARAVDRLLALHAFDAPYFEAEGLKTTVVGHTALSRDLAAADGARFRRELGLGAETPVLLVLPGSRAGEIARMAPVFGETARRLHAERGDLAVVVPVAPTVADQVRAAVAGWGVPVTLIAGEAAKDDAMRGATAAVACSGTVTTELALAGCPFVVGYKASAATAFAARLILKTRWLTLLNIAAGREAAPEFLQERCTPDALVTALAPILFDAAARERMRADQAQALSAMKPPGPPGRAPAEIAADAVLESLDVRRP